MPFYRCRMQSVLPPDEAARRLSAATGPAQTLFTALSSVLSDPATPPAREFHGEVAENRFSIQWRIGGRNSFLPRIKGRIVAEGVGSGIRVWMHLSPFAAVFMAAWIGMVGNLAIKALSAPGSSGIGGAGVLLGMALFAIALALIGFVPEAIKAKRRLAAVLEADGPASIRPPTVSR